VRPPQQGLRASWRRQARQQQKQAQHQHKQARQSTPQLWRRRLAQQSAPRLARCRPQQKQAQRLSTQTQTLRSQPLLFPSRAMVLPQQQRALWGRLPPARHPRCRCAPQGRSQ
jgi:hypothetical protein